MPVTSIKSRWVNGFLEFYDPATNEVVGVQAPVSIFDDFNGPAVDNTNDWNVTSVNSGTATAVDGFMILTTGSADDDNVEVCSDLVFDSSKIMVAECKLRNDDQDQQAFFFGFTDAITEGADDLPVDFSNSGALVTEATNAVGFVQDPDNTVTDAASLMCVAVNGNTDATPVDSGTDMADTVLHTLRVEVNADRTADFWVDGEHVGSVTTAIAADIPCCIYVGSITRHGSANTLDVDYVRAWGGRP